MRLVTTRPLPEGAHNFFHWAHYPYLTNCSMPLPTHLQTQFPFYVSVSKPVNAAHEAFFDPVDIGDAVGADATNGVLKPTTFTHDGTPVTISGLKWENGTVTLELSPTASLADYNLDFIDVTGTTTLSLTSDNASTTPPYVDRGRRPVGRGRPAHAANPGTRAAAARDRDDYPPAGRTLHVLRPDGQLERPASVRRSLFCVRGYRHLGHSEPGLPCRVGIYRHVRDGLTVRQCPGLLGFRAVRLVWRRTKQGCREGVPAGCP